MAKCVQFKLGGRVKRVSNKEAKQLYESGKIKYISKSDYDRITYLKERGK